MNERFARRKERAKQKPRYSLKERILVVCEGEETEPNYFKSFRHDPRQYKVLLAGTGYNTTSLVAFAETYSSKNKPSADLDWDTIYVVFDKDDFPEFSRAITKCESLPNFTAIWSNQSFELWLMLHFKLDFAAHHRSVYISELKNLIGYNKNIVNVRHLMAEAGGSEERAIANAKKLVSQYNLGSQTNFDAMNPCTMVYVLVERLRKMEQEMVG